MLFIVLFSVVTMFSNFQATFLLISPKVFGICTPNFTTRVRKIWLNFWYQNHSGFEKNWGMMLSIMSGTFKGNFLTFSLNPKIVKPIDQFKLICKSLKIFKFWVTQLVTWKVLFNHNDCIAAWTLLMVPCLFCCLRLVTKSLNTIATYNQ